MKKLLTSALLFASAFAFAEGYEDWFTPPDKWRDVKAPVKLVTNVNGAPVTIDFSVYINSTLNDVLWLIDEATSGLPESAKNAFKVSRLALANSLYASCQAHMNKLKIDNLGAALEGVFVSTYGQYVDEQGNVLSKSRSGVDTAKLRQQLLANKNAVVSGGQAAGGSEQNPLTIVVTQKPYDESQFEQHVANGRSLTSLKGWYGLSNTGVDTGDYTWAFSLTDFWFPITSGKDGELSWGRWNGWNAGCFSAGDDVSGGDNNKPLRLYGWATADNCSESIQNLLTNETATVDRSKHKILTRYEDSGGATIHWMPFDESVIGGGSEQVADDHTIVYTQDADAYIDDPKKFRIKGFDDANTAAASDPKQLKLACADGSTDLSWKKPSTLFNESVFDTDGNGKVILKATVTEEGKTEVMTITQNSSGGEVTSQSLEGKTLDYLTDNASLGAVEVSGDDKIGIKSWDRPQDAQSSFTIADKLENGTGYVNDPTRSPAVVIRNGGTLQYAAIGTMKPLQCDEQSITTNYTLGASVANKASIRGYREAEVGTVPKRTADGLEWVAMSEVDDTSVVTNENGQIVLKGFDTAKPEQASDGAVLPFVDATSDDLQWAGIENFFADSVFRKSSETGKILLNGTSEQGKVKVLAMTGSGGDDQTITALTFDNESVDGNPAAGGVVQLHAFATAPSPYASGNVSFADVLTNTTTQITGMSVPVRIPAQGTASGATVAYVPMGKITGIPAAAVDNKTIEVNEEDPQNKFLQLHGAAGDGIALEEGDVYQIGSDGKGKFAKLGAESEDAEVEAANASIESYTGTDGGKYFRLRDWMINREGLPHILGWSEHALKYWTIDGANGIDINSNSGGEEIMLSGFLDADEGAIPYAKKDGNGLGWLNGVDDRIPLLHADNAPTTMAIGSSLDKANVSAVPTLNVANFASGGNCSVSLNKMLSDPAETSNRSAHQFMARYASGGGDPSVHWVSIDDVIGGGSPVDNTSITTNYSAGASVDGTASLYGFRTASEGDVPHKKSDGTIEWKAAGGGAPCDDASITTNTVNGAVTSGYASIYGFSSASNKQVPTKNGTTGKIEWKNPVDVSAGTGISVTTQSDGYTKKIAVTDTGTYTTITYVSNIEWDAANHQLKMTKTSVSAKIIGSPTSTTSVILTAASHMEDHEEVTE